MYYCLSHISRVKLGLIIFSIMVRYLYAVLFIKKIQCFMKEIIALELCIMTPKQKWFVIFQRIISLRIHRIDSVFCEIDFSLPLRALSTFPFWTFDFTYSIQHSGALHLKTFFVNLCATNITLLCSFADLSTLNFQLSTLNSQLFTFPFFLR